ncbi:unnamed protein product [Ostreobium quekettii]|uniref:Uncharacterized protein n=1 Tax=Ostreobium quekettii TaxID=121088 RepID=A0A8S1J1V5_9CHLO|nr:unnamed protein product [Ostreobium quekettii]
MAVAQCPVANLLSMDRGRQAGRRSPCGSMAWAGRRMGGRRCRAWWRGGRTPGAMSCSLWAPQRFCWPLRLATPRAICRASPEGRRPPSGGPAPTGVDELRTEDEGEDEQDDALGAEEGPEPEFDVYFEEVEEDDLTTSVAVDPAPAPPPIVQRGGPVWSWAAAGAVAMLVYMSVWRWLFGNRWHKRHGREALVNREDVATRALLAGQDTEPVEWVNMSFRKGTNCRVMFSCWLPTLLPSEILRYGACTSAAWRDGSHVSFSLCSMELWKEGMFPQLYRA